MAVTSLLEMRFAPDHLVDGPVALREILMQTRAREGCLGVEIVTDVADPAHTIAIERWESIEHDDAYRTWRKGPGTSNLSDYLVAPATLTRCEDVAAL